MGLVRGPSHEALVTREEWEAVQAPVPQQQAPLHPHPKEGRHCVLAGRLSCGR